MKVTIETIDPVLLQFLYDATKDEKHRFSILSLAADYAYDTLRDELLAYVLRWLIKHKKFPIVKTRKVVSYKKERVNKTEVKKEFFAKLAKNPPSSYANVDVLLKEHIEKAKQKAQKAKKEVISFLSYYQFDIFTNINASGSQSLPARYFYYPHHRILVLDSWSKVIDFLKTNLKPAKDWFYLGE